MNITVRFYNGQSRVRWGSHVAFTLFSMATLIVSPMRDVVDTDRFELCFPLWLMTLLSISLASIGSQPPIVLS